MGMATAIDIVDSGVTFEQGLAWHLQGNHYPPIPKVMVSACIGAIDAYWENDLNREIPLPKMEDGFQIRWKNGNTTAPAWAIIEHAHLDAWCAEEYEEEE